MPTIRRFTGDLPLCQSTPGTSRRGRPGRGPAMAGVPRLPSAGPDRTAGRGRAVDPTLHTGTRWPMLRSSSARLRNGGCRTGGQDLMDEQVLVPFPCRALVGRVVRDGQEVPEAPRLFLQAADAFRDC